MTNNKSYFYIYIKIIIISISIDKIEIEIINLITKMFKILLLGNPNTGKSSWINSIKDEEFQTEYIPTTEVNIYSKTLNTITNGTINVSFWDVNSSCVEELYRDADLALIFYNVTDKKSYISLPTYIAKIKNICPFIIIANKSDDTKNIRICHTKHLNLINFYPSYLCKISVKTCLNLDLLELAILKILLRNPNLTYDDIYDTMIEN